ncbi:MAG: hypothetical protein KatS3mg031_3052 [Chitinophagales bacterium]|nr:MAG: hypothetical protein KatS3mg031_3052 [Chitinophagales bacterium]
MNVSSSQDYYPFGSVMEGREYNLAAYRFGFVGHERDNEIKGLGNSYYFGSRIFDTQLGRWLSVDVLQARYPGYSLYHYGYCNPIIVLDPNGKENIVVVGNQGDNPSSDKLPWYKRIFENSEYRYGEYKRHFLEAGLNAAIELKRNNTDNHEETTLLVYNGNYINKEISYYKKRAEKAGIKFKLVNSANDVKNYINESGGYIHGKKAPKGRTQDLITDFVYVGHGNNESLLLGHGHDEKDVLFGKDFKKESFSLDCDVWLLGCGNGLNIFDEFKQKVGGYVFGYTTTVVWGEKGIGSFAPFNMEYMRNGILRAIDYNRKELKPEERYRIEKGNRKK